MGLGNPGAEYAGSRHNAGAEAIGLLARRHGERLKRGRELALVAELRVAGPAGPQRLAVAFPQTFMNESGRSVVRLVRRFGITDMARLVVVHDELDLPTGRMAVKAGGGLAGHNGLRSIRAHLRTEAFTRVRIGIGKPPGGREGGIDHVLSAPSRRERTDLDAAIERAADAVEAILADGVAGAQNRFNG